MRIRLLSYTATVGALICAAFPGVAQASVNVTSSTGLTIDATGNNPNNIAWSSLTVSGVSGTIDHLTVTLNNWTDNGSTAGGLTREFVLQGPGGQTFEFAAQITNGGGFSNVTLTFDDSATSNPPSGFSASVSSGTFKPDVVVPSGNSLNQLCENFPTSGAAAFNPSTGVPTYDAPSNANCAQQTSDGTIGSVFNGLSANGTWVLWEYTNQSDISAASVGSWTLSITPAVAAGTTTAVSSSAPNNESFSGTSVTFTATVTSSNSNVAEGTVTFEDGNSTISGCGGVAVADGQAVCTTTLTGEGAHVITATYNGDANFNTSNGTVTQFVDNQTAQTGSTFCNNGTITLAEQGSGGGPGSPYPQHVFVSDLSGSVTGVTLTLQNVNAYLEPLQFLLVGPAGDRFIPLADAGGMGTKFTGNLVLSDAGGSLVPQNSTPAAGTYLPTDYNASAAFPAPAPTGSYNKPATVGSDTFASTFATEPVNDASEDKWSLYVSFTSDQGDTESIGGYCLTFTTSNLPSTTTSVQANPTPQATVGQGVTFTATVMSGGNPVTQGTVKFEENGTLLSGPTALNGSGQTTYTTSSLSEGIHDIEALYSGVPGSFNVSSGSVTEEIDTATTNPAAGQYCNLGGLSIGTTVNSAGEPASPYPSRIDVTNLAGTVNTVSIALNGFTHNDPAKTLMMLQGPTGTNIVFWDDAGSDNPVTSPLNITFSDSASGQLGVNASPTSTSYQPTANDSNVPIAFPSTAITSQPPPSPSYAASIGSQTLTSAFQNIDPNNYWSLFLFNRPGDYQATITNWCLNITTNPPVLTITKSHTGTFTQGDTADTYTIIVANPSGPGSTAGTLTLTDTLPAGMTATAMSETANSGGGTGSDWTCTASTATCTRTTPMAPGESDTITLTVSVSYSSATGTNAVTNSVTVSGGGISQSQTANDQTTVNVGAVQVTFGTNPAGLSYTVTTTAGSNTYTSGQTLTLTNGAQIQISTTTPQGTSPTQYTFANWSNGPTPNNTSQTIAVSPTTTSYTANFNTTYTTTVSASAPPVAYSANAQNVTLSATVASPVAVNGGTVTFTVMNGGTPLGSAVTSGTVANGAASATFSVPAGTAPGSYQIQANYSGSTAAGVSFTSGGDTSHNLVVNQASQTITFNTPPAVTYTPGLTVNLSGDATASSGLPVSYTLTGGTGVGSITGTTLTVTHAGTFLIQASQGGNTDYSGAASVQATLTVNAASQTITFNTPPAVTYTPGLTVNLSGDATASSGLGVTYTLQTGGTGVGSITGTTLTVTHAGTFFVQASQSGNTDYSAAASVQATLTVNAASQTITFPTPSAVTYSSGLMVNLSGDAMASSGLGVTYMLLTGGTGVGSITGTTLTVTQAGTFVIQASQSGNTDYSGAASVQATLTVNAASQTITFNTPAAVTYSSPLTVPLSGDASASSGLAVSYTLLTGGTGAGSITGTTLTVTQAGTFKIQANQGGNQDFTAAAAVQAVLTVNQAGQTITFNNPGSQGYGTAPTLSASSSSGLAVSLVSTTTTVCTVSGSTLTIRAVGPCSITASQPGNVDYLAATNVPEAFQIVPGPQIITFNAIPNQVVPGVPLTLSAIASSGLPVSFTSLTPLVCSVTGAPPRAKMLAPGLCTIQATQGGNSLYAPAAPDPRSFTVSLNP